MALVQLGPGWKPLVRGVLDALCPGVSDAEDALARLLDGVVEWNARTDLTAARSAEELADLYLADAAVLCRSVRESGDAAGRWVDVGSGAGAPAIPLALLAPELELQLVEPRDKRVAFLRTMLAQLGRTDVVVHRGRSQELPDAAFDVALSRATLPPGEWLREGARLATRAVWVLLARAEPPALDGWHADADLDYRWPLTGAQRRALRFVKK